MEEDVQHINENNQLLRYDNQIFTVITEENYEDVIHTFCEELYMADSGVQDAKIARNFVQELEKLLKSFHVHLQLFKKHIILIEALGIHIIHIFQTSILISNVILEEFLL